MKKILLTVFWVIIGAIWFGIYKYMQNAIDMYYSNLAAQQVEDDSVYGALKFHSTADTIATIVLWAGMFLFVYLVYRLWSKKNNTSKKTEIS